MLVLTHSFASSLPFYHDCLQRELQLPAERPLLFTQLRARAFKPSTPQRSATAGGSPVRPLPVFTLPTCSRTLTHIIAISFPLETAL